MAKITADFQNNVDMWIKEINSKISNYDMLPELLEENISNIDHNYELVGQLSKEVQELKEEIKLLKITQLMILEKSLKKVQ